MSISKIAVAGAAVAASIATWGFVLFAKAVADGLSQETPKTERKFKIGQRVKFNDEPAMVIAVKPHSVRVENGQFASEYVLRLKNSNVVSAYEFELSPVE